MKWNGLYFLYGTATNFPVMQSKDLVTWEYIGDALDFSTLVGSQDFWAPEVVYRNGKFYLYVSYFLVANIVVFSGKKKF